MWFIIGSASGFQSADIVSPSRRPPALFAKLTLGTKSRPSEIDDLQTSVTPVNAFHAVREKDDVESSDPIGLTRAQ
jgi:hypothetical protein